ALPVPFAPAREYCLRPISQGMQTGWSPLTTRSRFSVVALVVFQARCTCIGHQLWCVLRIIFGMPTQVGTDTLLLPRGGLSRLLGRHGFLIRMGREAG